MIHKMPAYISVLFVITTMVTLVLFICTIRNSKTEATRKIASPVLFGLIIWLIIQLLLSYNNIYAANTQSFPPTIFVSGVLPTILTILFLFLNKKGGQFIDSLPIINLTYLNIIRVPVEVVLFWLCIYKSVPELMTFEGRNFDIVSGLTAPVVAYLVFAKNKIGRRGLLAWNIICLGLLINIVVNAALAIPSSFQQFAFDQPNVAILYFPFSWLPTFIVPVVLLAHLVSIRQLIQRKYQIKEC